MIKIKGSVEEFKEWLLPVAAVADEAKVLITPEGISIKVIDPAYEMGLFWRLPFPDEDNVRPGYYDPYNRGDPLIGFDIKDAEKHPGIIQVSHECGILVNLPCLHGQALPESTGDLKLFWNGRAGWFWNLSAIKNTKEGVKAVVSCRFCDRMWTADIGEIIEYVKDAELKRRLMDYIDAKVTV